MQIQVDGSPHPLLQTNPLNLSAVLAEIDSAMEARGRVIQSIEIDGERVSVEDLNDALLNRRPAEVKQLVITTEAMGALVVRALDDLEEVVSELPAACHSLASLLNGDEREEAVSKFPELSGIWLELMDRQRQVLAVLSDPPKSFPPDNLHLHQRHHTVSQKLLEASRAAVDRDLVSLADMLTHELAPLAEDEATVLAGLKSLGSAQV